MTPAGANWLYQLGDAAPAGSEERAAYYRRGAEAQAAEDAMRARWVQRDEARGKRAAKGKRRVAA